MGIRDLSCQDLGTKYIVMYALTPTEYVVNYKISGLVI
jgi:hypothetical protein